MPDYLDTSAFIKLVRSEPESRALRKELASSDALISSALLTVEAQRAAARYGAVALDRTRAALGTITLLPVDDDTLDIAARVEPPLLRSLDALHLATALSLADTVRCFYCYDARLSAAAAAARLDVRSPA